MYVHLQVDGEAAMDGEAGGVEPRLLGVPDSDSSMSSIPTLGVFCMVMFCDVAMVGELPGLWYVPVLKRRSMILLASVGTAFKGRAADTNQFSSHPESGPKFYSQTLRTQVKLHRLGYGDVSYIPS